MNRLIELLCSRLGCEMPEQSENEWTFGVEGRQVTVVSIKEERRCYVYSGATIGTLDAAGYIRLGRFGFSWAVGSDLSIGLHPATEGLALVGCGVADTGNLLHDVDALHLAMRRVSMAAATLESNLTMPNPAHRSNPGGATARNRQSIMSHLLESEK
jgi:hypothetical protein